MKISLSFPDCGTDVPYFNPDEHDPAHRHEYVDLRENPAAIDDLPEIVTCPAFRDYLLQINGGQSIFRTFGCSYVFSASETHEVGPPIPPSTEPQTETYSALASSYMHVAFAELDRCANRDDYYRLCGRLSQHLWSNPNYAESDDGVEHFTVGIAFEWLRLVGEHKGTVLSIDCETTGFTDDEARENWIALMADISGFLAAENLA